MDGRIAAVRAELPETPIVAYSAKYASAFYGPFREAAGSAPSFGDRRGYQMDPGNVREALRECELDVAEGADVLIVKPALPYLDVIRAVRDRFDLPLGAYNVSGEYAMVKAAAAAGDLDERAAALESLTAIRRAGADDRDHLLGEGARRLALVRSELWHRAQSLIPGGVNSPVRAMRAVGVDEPFFVARGEGAYLETTDGRRLLDWVQSWGPLIFGHADAETVEAVREAALDGTSFGAPTEREVELAAEIVDAVPSVERVRLVSSGTEAAMSAVRLARAFTHRDRVIKFAGCYHGHADPFLAEAGSGLATLGIPSSPGVPSAVTADTIVVPYNDVDAVAAAVERYGEGLAAIIVEPVAGNMGCVPPAPGFLEALRMLCDASGALLVFDEVITGFRVARGGAQERFGVTPDLTMLGKIAGGGLPLAAFGGRAEIMARLAPVGDVYQAGTLSGNPLATAAGLSVLRRLRDVTVYEELERRAARLEEGLAPFGRVQRVGAMLTFFVGGEPVTEFRPLDTETLRRALPPPARARDLRRAEPVRVPVPVARPRRRRDRRDDRGRGRVLRGDGGLTHVGRLVDSARSESPLWAPSLRPSTSGSWWPSSRRSRRERFALGLETIYEAYLVHYGRSRLFDPPDEGERGAARRLPLRARARADRGRGRGRRGRGDGRADLALRRAARRRRRATATATRGSSRRARSAGSPTTTRWRRAQAALR